LTFQRKCIKLKAKIIALQEGTAVCTRNSFEIVSVGMYALWEYSLYLFIMSDGK